MYVRGGSRPSHTSVCLQHLTLQIMMEVAFTQQRDVLSREAMEKEERIDMLKRGGCAQAILSTADTHTSKPVAAHASRAESRVPICTANWPVRGESISQMRGLIASRIDYMGLLVLHCLSLQLSQRRRRLRV